MTMTQPEEPDETVRKTRERARTLAEMRVGDAVTRVLPRDGGKPDIRNYGRVVEVTGEEVVALIAVDVERTMRFDRATGVNLDGPDYGYLEARVAHQAASAGTDGTQACVRCGKVLRQPSAGTVPAGAPVTDDGREITQVEAKGMLICPTEKIPASPRDSGRW